MPGVVLISAFFHELVQKEWQSPDGAFLCDPQSLPAPAGFALAVTPPTVHRWQAISILTNSGAPFWRGLVMPVALCTDVDVWHRVALV